MSEAEYNHDCTFRRYLQDYLDGALSTQDEKAFIKHLDECERCLSEVQQYRKIASTITADVDHSVGDDFEKSVLRKIRSVPLQKGTHIHMLQSLRKWVYVAAAAVVLVAIVPLVIYFITLKTPVESTPNVTAKGDGFFGLQDAIAATSDKTIRTITEGAVVLSDTAIDHSVKSITTITDSLNDNLRSNLVQLVPGAYPQNLTGELESTMNVIKINLQKFYDDMVTPWKNII